MANLFIHHPYLASTIATWLFNNIVTALISNLPAPTKDSTPNYVYWFKVLNTIIGNLQRAKSTALEQSPNWQDAKQVVIQQHIEQNGQQTP